MKEITWHSLGASTAGSSSHSRPDRTLRHRRFLQKRILHAFSVALHWFEVAIGFMAVVFVAIGTVFMLAQLTHFNEHLITEGLHHGFENLLSDILLLVVGVELAIMLVRRTPESLVEVMFFVIARKMLIKTGAIWELLIGVAALGGLFAIRKYLEHSQPARQMLLKPRKDDDH